MKNKMMKLINKKVFIFLFFVILVVFFGFIYKYSFRMLFWDQWGIVEPVTCGKIDFSMWQYQHNEHRIGTSLILIKILAIITGWSNLVETMFEGLMILVVGIICFWYFKIGTSKKYDLFDLTVPLVIFNLNQWGNLTWGFQIIFVMPILLLFVNLYLFQKRNSLVADSIILIVGILATRSAFHGIFVPLISAIYYIFLIFKIKKIDFKLFFLFVLNILVMFSYFLGLETNGMNVDLNFIHMAKYGISLLNNFIGYRHLDWLGLLLPVYTALTIIQYILKKRKNVDLFVFGMLGFSALFIFATSMGRSNLGVGQAFSSRYNTAVFPLFLAVYYMIKKIGTKTNKWLFFIIILVAFFQGLYLAKTDLHIYAFKKGTDAWKSCYLEKDDAYLCEKETGGFLIYPDLKTGDIVNKLDMLKERNMNFLKKK